MNNLVFKSNKGNLVTTSLLVAQKFGKEHKNVIASIKDILRSAENSAHFYHSVTYKDSLNRTQEMFVMNRDGFSLLVMGFTGPEALQFKIDFIEAFNKMEAELKAQLPQTFAEALQLAANQAKQIEEAQNKIKEQEPKVLFADSVSASEKSILVSDLAKIIKQNGYDIGQNRLFEWLRKHGYLCSKGAYYNHPTQMAMNLGLFEMTERTINPPDKEPFVTISVKVTGKGQIYFLNKFLTSKAA